MPSQKYLQTYYAKQFSYRDGLQNETVIRKRGQIILKKIQQLSSKAKSLCDVGSGYGFFLNEASIAGYNVIGIEPSLRLARHTKDNYQISIFVGELKKYVAIKHKQFDVVTCIHVIEHVSNPSEFFLLLLRLVKPGGILYIETPNSDSHLLYVEKDNYTFLIPPDHLWIFSKKAIQVLLPSYAYIFLEHTYSYSQHLMGIIKTLSSRQHYQQKNIFHAQGEKIQKNGMKSNMLRNVKKRVFYYLFDRTLAPLFTGLLNLHHKGSILELYIKKK
ncbi:MAG: class I SAM-dependent methyltransferase [bacterium]